MHQSINLLSKIDTMDTAIKITILFFVKVLGYTENEAKNILKKYLPPTIAAELAFCIILPKIVQ